MIPIQTREALEALGLTDEQVQGAWDIIIDHLGIASPPKGHLDIYAEPGEPVDVRKPETKHTIPITEMIK
jgi:hypothetical protein